MRRKKLEYMKYILPIILFLSISLPVAYGVDKKHEDIRSLKLADAYQTGMNKELSFRLHHGQHKETFIMSVIQREFDLPSFTSEEEIIIPCKSYLIKQIFIPIGQRVDLKEEHKLRNSIDSLFEEVVKNRSDENFDSLIEEYSADKEARWVLEYEETAEFHVVLKSLNIGEFSRPFLTPKGIHIVKKIDEADSVKIVQPNKVENMEILLQRYGLSVNKNAKLELLSKGTTDKILIESDNALFDGASFQRFLLGNPAMSNDQLWNHYLKYVLIKDLKARIMKDSAFSQQLTTLYEDDLLDVAYNKRVRQIALGNEEGLNNYFEQNKESYYWASPRFKGLLVFCRNNKVRKKLHNELSSAPLGEWRAILDSFNKNETQVLYELGTFKEGENGAIDSYVFKKGKKKQYRKKGYKKTRVYGEIIRGPETIDLVQDEVLQDYMSYLEQQWEKQLISLYNAGKLPLNFLKTVNNQASN